MSADEERVYLALVHGASTEEEVAELAGVQPELVQSAVASLQADGLLSRSAEEPFRLVPAPPDAAIEVLILRQQRQLEQVRLRAAELMAVYRETVASPQSVRFVELVWGRDAISQRFEHVQRTAKKEVLGFDCPPYIGYHGTANLTELQLLAEGVRYRCLYDRAAFERPHGHGLEAIYRQIEAGEEARVLAGVPMKLVIADGEMALVPLSTGLEMERAILVRPCALLDALLALFELLWQNAIPVSLPSDVVADLAANDELAPTSQSADRRALLTMLASGMSDRAIARELGVSVRTVTRRIADLMAETHSVNRFQLGWQVRDRHLL